MSERKQHEPTQLVIDTRMFRNIGAGLLFGGAAAGGYITIQFSPSEAWGGRGPGGLDIQAQTEIRQRLDAAELQQRAFDRELEGLGLIYRELRDDYAASGEEGAQAWRRDARHEAIQDVKIEGLDEKVSTHLNGEK